MDTFIEDLFDDEALSCIYYHDLPSKETEHKMKDLPKSRCTCSTPINISSPSVSPVTFSDISSYHHHELSPLHFSSPPAEKHVLKSSLYTDNVGNSTWDGYQDLRHLKRSTDSDAYERITRRSNEAFCFVGSNNYETSKTQNPIHPHFCGRNLQSPNSEFHHPECNADRHQISYPITDYSVNCYESYPRCALKTYFPQYFDSHCNTPSYPASAFQWDEQASQSQLTLRKAFNFSNQINERTLPVPSQQTDRTQFINSVTLTTAPTTARIPYPPTFGSHKKPVQSLSAYNFFYRHQRERILAGCADDDDGDSDSEYTSRQKEALLLNHWHKDRSEKRRHRKTHGKVSFAKLTQMVAQKWKHIPEHRKDFYRDVAIEDLNRYRFETLQYEMVHCRSNLYTMMNHKNTYTGAYEENNNIIQYERFRRGIDQTDGNTNAEAKMKRTPRDGNTTVGKKKRKFG